MDIFCEQIIKQAMDTKRVLIIAASVCGVIAICVAAMIFMPWVFMPVAALSGFGIYWIASMQSWEVEYAVTNGEIDIDRIVARRERKKLVRVRGEKIECLLPVSKLTEAKRYDRIVMAAKSKSSATWAFTYQGKMGATLVLFEPDDAVLDALYKGLPRTVQIETDRARREL